MSGHNFDPCQGIIADGDDGSHWVSVDDKGWVAVKLIFQINAVGKVFKVPKLSNLQMCQKYHVRCQRLIMTSNEFQSRFYFWSMTLYSNNWLRKRGPYLRIKCNNEKVLPTTTKQKITQTPANLSHMGKLISRTYHNALLIRPRLGAEKS